MTRDEVKEQIARMKAHFFKLQEPAIKDFILLFADSPAPAVIYAVDYCRDNYGDSVDYATVRRLIDEHQRSDPKERLRAEAAAAQARYSKIRSEAAAALSPQNTDIDTMDDATLREWTDFAMAEPIIFTFNGRSHQLSDEAKAMLAKMGAKKSKTCRHYVAECIRRRSKGLPAPAQSRVAVQAPAGFDDDFAGGDAV